jgi:phosphoribosylformylglycinamidine synthase subunit PurQ / glutaminase
VRVEPLRARLAVIQFPGTNCERETVRALTDVLGCPVDLIWHADVLDPDAYAAVILPGGFAHGDHLRAGAIARFSPAMRGVHAAARAGQLVMGICNGFQVLLEAGLLPGAMLRNASLEFRSCWVHCRVERNDTPFTAACTPGQVLRMPIAHGEGNYTASSRAELERLEASGSVVLRYCDAHGRVAPEANPNGSANNIAAICAEAALPNVFGLMPHPERAIDRLLGSADGRLVFESLRQTLARSASHAPSHAPEKASQARQTGTGVAATPPQVSLSA